MKRKVLRAPFPWFGGKYHAADLVWRAFGNVPNFVEPFAGSIAVLLARPHAPKVETANDKDGLICNFWRAVKHAPAKVAKWADDPVNEADLHARHQWLVAKIPGLLRKLIANPDYHDPKIAGWWVWGLCAWIGNGWCYPDERVNVSRQRPKLGHGMGTQSSENRAPDWKRRPILSHSSGVHAAGVRSPIHIPLIGTPGNGIHAPSRKKPLTHRNKGVHRSGVADLEGLFADLCARLRDVRICCGDWTRVLGRSTLGIDTAHGMTPCGILLDPPYTHVGREKRLYKHDDATLSGRVREWALENGDNPQLRIALCGWDGEHDMPSTWTEVAWRGNSSARSRHKERIYFSPHCLPVDAQVVLEQPRLIREAS